MKVALIFLVHLWSIACAIENDILLENTDAKKPTPVVIWHGMGDNCCHSFSMGRIKELLEDNIKGNILC